MKPKIVYLLDFTALTAFLVAAPSINLVRLVPVILAGRTVHRLGRHHLRTVLHEISEASDHSEHCVRWLGGELCSLGGLGCSDGTTYSAGALVDGPLGLRLDSQPFLGAGYEGCGRLFKGWNPDAAGGGG